MEIAAGGELYDFLSDRKCLEELDARRVFRQIATAVYYCHKNNICHRDLKLENILLDENGNAKVHTVWSFIDVAAKDLLAAGFQQKRRPNQWCFQGFVTF